MPIFDTNVIEIIGETYCSLNLEMFSSLLLFLTHLCYRSAATALAQRHAGGSLPVEDFNLELENQSGEKVQLGSETDQRYGKQGTLQIQLVN